MGGAQTSVLARLSLRSHIAQLLGVVEANGAEHMLDGTVKLIAAIGPLCQELGLPCAVHTERDELIEDESLKTLGFQFNNVQGRRVCQFTRLCLQYAHEDFVHKIGIEWFPEPSTPAKGAPAYYFRHARQSAYDLTVRVLKSWLAVLDATIVVADRVVASGDAITEDDVSLASVEDLVKRFPTLAHMNSAARRQWLARFRKRRRHDFKELADAGGREHRFMYRSDAIRADLSDR